MNFLQKTLFGVNRLISPLYRIPSKTNQGRQLKQILSFPANNLCTSATNTSSFLQHSSFTFKQCPLFIGKSQILSKTPSVISSLPQNEGINHQVRTYKVKLHPKRRCKGCYSVRRNGRLFIECDLKPRHKQMELQSKDQLWKEDYSKGSVRAAAFWKWSKESWYRKGNNEWARFDWLQGKYDSKNT